MAEKNRHFYQNILGIFAVLVMVTVLVVIAGCLLQAPEKPPAVPSACSTDAGVCTFPVTHSVRIEATPQLYTPPMSSTPGIGLIPNISGFNPEDAEFTWNASYGYFLEWGPPNYTVRRLSEPVVNHGEKVYWSFIDIPASTSDPVIISVTARDLPSGQIRGSSRLTLGWEGNFTVRVQKIE